MSGQDASTPPPVSSIQPGEPDPPRTLAEAHEAVAALRPARSAPLGEWLAFHQRSAAVYAEVAEIDRGHHHEALFMVEQERQRVKEIKTQIASQCPAGEE
ncbi:MAG: hypothetical protein M3Y48_03425 [Actinomycetota bacterium]|nr:hypothetical protein [Actinomycetota bacterium]